MASDGVHNVRIYDVKRLPAGFVSMRKYAPPPSTSKHNTVNRTQKLLCTRNSPMIHLIHFVVSRVWTREQPMGLGSADKEAPTRRIGSAVVLLWRCDWDSVSPQVEGEQLTRLLGV